MENLLSSIKDLKKDDKKKDDGLLDILDAKEIINSLEIIKDKVKNKLENNNKDSILSLAKVLSKMKEMIVRKENKIKKLELINQEFTNDVYKYCTFYFEKELMETEGLSFMVNYFNKLESLLEDIKYYINKKDWGNII